MTNHTTGTRAEWLDARLELLKAEKELTRMNDDVARQRRALPWVRLEKDYLFDTEDGEATLAGVHERGLEPVAVLVRRSTLEDVFLRLTGRTLVD